MNNEKKYKITNKGIVFMQLYEIKKISTWILLISILILIANLVQMIAMIK